MQAFITVKGPRRVAGFTLIELMITVAIVAILASIAYPSYQDHVRQSRRADAQTALLELAQFMERYYTANGRYCPSANGIACTNPPGLPFTQAPKDGARKFYDLSLSAVTPTTYTLQAAPIAGTMMAGDGCGNLTIAHTGVRGRAGALPFDRCWRQ